MIAQTLQTLVNEVTSLWYWTLGIIAGWGLTFTVVVITLIILYIRAEKLKKKVISLENRTTAELRDLSIRLRNLEK